jgi:predicted RNase H-like nuclease
MRFVGVDLAWSDRNPTGIAVLEGDQLGARLTVEPWTVRGVDAVAEAVGAACPDGPAFVAVDAPLWVPNATGRRPCEAELGRDFARFHAGAHPANRTRLTGWDGSVAGERLVALLRERYRLAADPNPLLDSRSGRRLVFEAFPHPAMVVLFGLSKRLLYKKGDAAQRREGLARLRRFVLAVLGGGAPPLLPSETLSSFCGAELDGLRGAALKDYEDRLDAVVCAYIALYYWTWGGSRCRMYGNLADGHIIVPRWPPYPGA